MILLKKWTRECQYSDACYKNKNKKNKRSPLWWVFFFVTLTLRLTYQSLIGLAWQDAVSISKYNNQGFSTGTWKKFFQLALAVGIMLYLEIVREEASRILDSYNIPNFPNYNSLLKKQ